MMGAGLRRAGVYVVAAILVVVAGLYAARWARPSDPYRSVEVIGLSSGGGDASAETKSVHWDSARGRGVVDVQESDGVVRRYYMESGSGGGTRVWGGAAVEDEGTGPGG